MEDKLLCRQSWQMGEEQAVENAEDFAKQAENQPACSQLLHEVAYEYNSFGQLIKATNNQYQPFEATHVTAFEYDEQHRLIAEIQDGKRLEISLDEYGRQVGLQLPNAPQRPQSAVKIAQHFAKNWVNLTACYKCNSQDFKPAATPPLQKTGKRRFIGFIRTMILPKFIHEQIIWYFK